MDALVILGGFILIALYVRLRNRVTELEGRVSALLKKQSTAPQPMALNQAASQPIATQLEAKASTQKDEAMFDISPKGPDALDRFGAWLKEDWLLKLGALLILIGFGWFASYAFLHGWIGPMGRIALGISAGVCIIILGWWRIQTYLHQGGVFIVVGSATIILTIFAAREIYDFFTPLTALAVMFLSTVFVALASVKYGSRSLALSGLVLASAAPLLTNSPTPDYVSLFSYLLVVVLGAIWVVVLTGQRVLTLAAFIIVVLYSISYSSVYYFSTDRGGMLLFVYIFSIIFFITNTAGIVRSKTKDYTPDLLTALGTGIFLLSWIIYAAEKEWQSLIIVAWMVVFLAAAFALFKLTSKREPFYIYAGVGLSFLAAATALELDGAALTIAYTLESVATIILSRFLFRDRAISERLLLLLLGPIALSMTSVFSRLWYESVFNKDFFVLGILASSLIGLGLYFMASSKKDGTFSEQGEKISGGLLIIGSLYVYVLLWLSLHAALQDDDIAVMLSLVVYTLGGLAAYFTGTTRLNKNLRAYGAILLAFVVGRLLLIEVWNMEITGRIITFFLIGTLLMSTAFFGKRKRLASLAQSKEMPPAIGQGETNNNNIQAQ